MGLEHFDHQLSWNKNSVLNMLYVPHLLDIFYSLDRIQALFLAPVNLDLDVFLVLSGK